MLIGRFGHKFQGVQGGVMECRCLVSSGNTAALKSQAVKSVKRVTSCSSELLRFFFFKGPGLSVRTVLPHDFTEWNLRNKDYPWKENIKVRGYLNEYQLE